MDELGDPSQKLFEDLLCQAIFVEVDGRTQEKLVWIDSYDVSRFNLDWEPIESKNWDAESVEKPGVETAGSKRAEPKDSAQPRPSTGPKVSAEPKLPADPKSRAESNPEAMPEADPDGLKS